MNLVDTTNQEEQRVFGKTWIGTVVRFPIETTLDNLKSIEESDPVEGFKLGPVGKALDFGLENLKMKYLVCVTAGLMASPFTLAYAALAAQRTPDKNGYVIKK